ncbi:WYL domain-containing protein [Paenibacillus montanisoli]|uniref:WYL domain-containing protein n=1 Tax=Paenibacillus montanisoli TaxID=2081970 RepID=A0A328U4K5_9BACL|nr:WYL domain-containing protein [Paenibacillus montanisoli]RAP74934.1 WYL domain-containing protein [Paenibacillus montanisoli]
MNPFEKIFNYQVISRLENSGTFMVTSHERSWLKLMLRHPAAAAAFSAETLTKLHGILGEEQSLELELEEHFVEKARSLEKQVYHPLLRSLSRAIIGGSGLTLSYKIKNDRVHERQLGVPYKMEYSMVKREWYLLWYNLRHRSFMRTKLANISLAEPADLAPERIKQAIAFIRGQLDKRKEYAVIEVMPAYNRELSRILYAFSCFDKTVDYDEDNGVYKVNLGYLSDESEYVLSKIRFLGKRVRVAESDYLRKRMLESSGKALARYGVLLPDQDEQASS